ncbi:recombinase family protein [Nostoc sp. FACHB-87]|uniref:fdxN element excision recombinase XisF n=1 Tax=Nostocaceae TaxID=1162 RepID=UPI0016828C21|nr:MULTISPECIES: fdxN element excision recombinase XisF [Nostocaceae]MBD2458219.1 recombinase family protein [Nostoc sp. FACHB-87]MBD2480079.1 recombinase family protein [Anabaena sp. FACHB-83]
MNSQDKIAKIPEVVAYARVSSREQAENSAALDQQIARLKAAGAEIVLTDTESGREGKEDQRSNFQKLMQWVRGGLVKQVIITRLDRLSRSLPTLRKVLSEFQESECLLLALDDNLDLSTATGKFHVNMLGALAEMESDRLSERIRRGKEHFRKEKRASHAPFGYIVRNYRFYPNREPFLCLLADKKEYSKADMARDLIEHYITKKSLNEGCRYFQNRYGYSEFWQTAFKRWLTSPVLQGDLVYYPKSKNPEIHPNTHEALLSREEAQTIKDIIDFNRKIGGFGHRRGVYSLTGLVRCECGGGCVVATGSKGVIKYFVCARTRLGRCERKHSVKIDKLENAVIEALISRADEIALFANVGFVEESPELQDLRIQLAELEALTNTRRNVNPAISEAMRKLRNQIEHLQQQTQNQDQINLNNRELLRLVASRHDFWAEQDTVQKQKFFRALVDHVLVSNGKILQVVLKV